MASGSKLVLFAALAGNVAIAVTKFVAAAFTGSSSMLTEGIHSVVDSGDQVLMLYGRRRSRRPPDDIHPLGHGREIYFWSFVVALLIFTLGAGMSIYEGIVHIRHPEMLSKPLVNYGVIAVAMGFEGTSLSFAVREFRQRKRSGETWWEALRSSKDPAIFVVLLEDSAALTGLLIAACFIGLTLLTGNPFWDGFGSVLIGVLLAFVAMVLARECKELLIGERAAPEIRERIGEIAQNQDGVCVVNEVLAVHLAPEQVVVMVSIDFDDALRLDQVEEIAMSIEREARKDVPAIQRMFIRPQSRQAARSESDDLVGREPADDATANRSR